MIMKRFLTILSIPFVLAGVLFWSAAVMLKVAVLTLFSRLNRTREIRIKPNACLYNHG